MHGGRPEDRGKTMLCHPQFRVRDGRSLRWRAASFSYAPPQVRAAYGLPPGLTGKGAKVGVVELGGAFSASAYAAAMNAYGVKSYLPVRTAGTQQSDPGGADVEVMLDACVIGGLAPLCQQTIYFAPNTDAGFVQAVTQAAGENDCVSISWGSREDNWPAQSRADMDAALRAASARDVSVFVASGDNGSSDGGSGNRPDYPAASPYAVGCGGTYLVIQGGAVSSESGWSDSGGGFSQAEPMPAWQHGLVNGSMRGVPDVAGPGDPNSGWAVYTDDGRQSVGGTSAVAPMWAAVLALALEARGSRVPWLPPLIYGKPAAFRDITAGNNGAYNAGPGWDAVTGLGSPNGPALFALLTAGGVAPPPPPPPPPPPAGGVTRAQAEMAAAHGAADYAANYPALFRRLLEGVVPWQDRRLEKLPW